MANISFQQEVSNNQILVKLVSSNLPAGALNVSVGFSYTASQASFKSAQFSGSSSTSISSNSNGSVGTVNITGSVFPSSGNPFATLVFNAQGEGNFNVDITSLRINGAAQVFTDPPSFAFNIVPASETLAFKMGESISGKFNPLDSFFPSTSIKVKAEHGSVTFDSFSKDAWKYVPNSGFYGQDTFTLVSSGSGTTSEKKYVLNISPIGTAGNDVFQSSKAPYTVDGGVGIDVMKYTGSKANFTISNNSGTYTVADKTGAIGTQSLTNFERLQFGDTNVALDGSAAAAYRIYQAAFDRKPDTQGLGYWIAQTDKGLTLQDVAWNFLASTEFQQKYGTNLSDTGFITALYANVLHRTPDKAGFDYWTDLLGRGIVSRHAMLAEFSESPENQAQVVGSIQNGVEYQYFA